jgi:hypothetical protein
LLVPGELISYGLHAFVLLAMMFHIGAPPCRVYILYCTLARYDQGGCAHCGRAIFSCVPCGCVSWGCSSQLCFLYVLLEIVSFPLVIVILALLLFVDVALPMYSLLV